MNFNCPIVETSDSTDSNDNDLELNAIAYTFSRIIQPEMDTAEIRFLGRDTVFCWPAVHLNKTTKCLQLLHCLHSESCRQSKRYKT